MRHGAQNRHRRHRGPNNGGNRGPTHNRNQIFDSNGPEVRIRGTAHQVCEKYLALAKDAASSGDLVLAESYLQHAEHYQRIINTWNEEFRDYARPNIPPPAVGDNVVVEDDLALPISILGGDVQTVQKNRVAPSADDEFQGGMLESA
jgi:hypothetical protein